MKREDSEENKGEAKGIQDTFHYQKTTLLQGTYFER